MTLDAEFCAFECGNHASGVREYRRNARESVWLAACDDCDARARTDLARAEWRFGRQTLSSAGYETESEEARVARENRADREQRLARQARETRKERAARQAKERALNTVKNKFYRDAIQRARAALKDAAE